MRKGYWWEGGKEKNKSSEGREERKEGEREREVR
jgi:hypothetical protein